MIIGIPKEIMVGEARVSATPETVKKFVQDGMTVLVQAGAGVKSLFSDDSYREAGAQIIDNSKDLFGKSDLILKVKEPQFNDEIGLHEIDIMRKNQYLITFLHPASPNNHKMINHLAESGVIGLTLDGVPRISRAQSMDALTSMSTCAGYKGMLMAADELALFMPQMFTAVGVLKPANVLVIGAGVAGLQALATAKRLGAVTYAIDIRPAAAEQAKSLGAKIIDTGVPSECAVGDGGYALKLSNEWLEVERKIISEIIKEMDIVFCSALIPGKVAPILITEDMVKIMKSGSVIMDVSIDQGGNCEITPAGKKEKIHSVTIEGVKNIPGLIPSSSTWMFAHNMYNLVKYLVKDNRISLDMEDEIVRSILVTYDNEVVHEGAKEAMEILLEV